MRSIASLLGYCYGLIFFLRLSLSEITTTSELLHSIEDSVYLPDNMKIHLKEQGKIVLDMITTLEDIRQVFERLQVTTQHLGTVKDRIVQNTVPADENIVINILTPNLNTIATTTYTTQHNTVTPLWRTHAVQTADTDDSDDDGSSDSRWSWKDCFTSLVLAMEEVRSLERNILESSQELERLFTVFEDSIIAIYSRRSSSSPSNKINVFKPVIQAEIRAYERYQAMRKRVEYWLGMEVSQLLRVLKHLYEGYTRQQLCPGNAHCMDEGDVTDC